MAETIWRGVLGGRELTVLRQPDGTGGVSLRVQDGHGLFEVADAESWADADEAAAIHLAEKFARDNPPPSDIEAHRAKVAANENFWASVPRLPSPADDYQAWLQCG